MSALDESSSPIKGLPSLSMRGELLHLAGAATRIPIRYSLLLSAVMHSVIIGLIFSSSLNRSSIKIDSKPLIESSFDISLIPLSALETNLPRGVPIRPQTPFEPELAPPPQLKPAAVAHSEPAPKKVAQRVAPAISKLQKRVQPIVDKDISSSQSRSAAASEQSSRIAPTVSSPSSSDTTSSQRSAPHPFGTTDGDATSLEQARISYQDMVATRLARAKRYPERALIRRKTGEGSIRLEISADGSVSQMTILRSTNTPILDEELLAMVKRASPFPAFPMDLRKDRVAFIIPVAFRLEG